jgi:serine/threonine-protein kinase
VRVAISSVPSGLTVYVRRRRYGSTPTRARLAPGSHSLRLRSKSYGIDYTTKIRVPRESSHSVSINIPSGRLAVRARPYATVFVDGRRLGLTPMPPIKLYVGRHRVRLVNDSLGRSVSRTVMIRSGQRSGIDVDLTKAP